MPQRQEAFVVQCAGGVLPTAPTEVPLPCQGGRLRRVRIVIPAGHSGITGIALGYGHQNTIPRGNGAFYSGDDDDIRLDIIDNVPGVQWSAFLCNGDIIAHVWEVDLEFDELVETGVSPSVTQLSPADIVNAGVDVMNAAS